LANNLTGKTAMPTNSDMIEDPYEFQKLLGFEITDWAVDTCALRLPIGPHLSNRYGIPHGGVYASVLDTVMGFSGCFTGNPDHVRRAMTLTMNVNYLSRPKGKVLFAKGHRIGGGARTFFAEARLSDETGELIATASGSFRYRRET